MTINTVKFSKPVTFTEATIPNGVSIATVSAFPELMPDVNFDGACGDGTWVCVNGTGTTFITGGQANISPAGSIRLNGAGPVLDPLKTYTTVIIASQVGSANVTVGLGGTSTRDVALTVGTNIFTGWTGTEVGSGMFQMAPQFAADPDTIVDSWSVKEEFVPKTFTMTSSSGSGTNLVPYDGTWDVDLVPGDIVQWDYDGTGDYVDIITPDVVVLFKDVFVDTPLISITDVNHIIDTDTSGARWSGSSALRITSTGSEVDATLNGAAANIDASVNTFKIKTAIRTSIASGSTDTRILVRRQVNANGNDEIRCIVLFDSVTGITQIRIQNRVASSPTTMQTITVAADISIGFVEFTVEDDGSGIVFTCVPTGESITVTNADITANGGSQAVSNFCGINIGTDSQDSFFKYFEVVQETPVPVKAHSIILENCEN